jgi:hypothetical protein
MFIIQLICNIVLFVCWVFVVFHNKQLRNYIEELKGDIADAKFVRQTLINQQEKKIKTLRIRCSKYNSFPRKDGRASLSFNVAKRYIADSIVEQIINDNILQIKEFDSYYEGSVDFVKSETNFSGGIND